MLLSSTPSSSSSQSQDSDASAQRHIQEAWDRVKRRLRAELGEDVFSSWFGRLELVSISDDVAHLSVPTRFLKSWIESHYLDRLRLRVSEEMPAISNVNLAVRSALQRPVTRHPETPPSHKPRLVEKAPSAPLESRSVPTDQDGLAGSPLDRRLTFASFLVGRSNALAHAAAERVARHEPGQTPLYNPLYVHSAVGLGKTHLLHAIGHEVIASSRRVIYLTADRFMYGFVAALKAQTALAFKERLRGIDLLIMPPKLKGRLPLWRVCSVNRLRGLVKPRN